MKGQKDLREVMDAGPCGMTITFPPYLPLVTSQGEHNPLVSQKSACSPSHESDTSVGSLGAIKDSNRSRVQRTQTTQWHESLSQ